MSRAPRVVAFGEMLLRLSPPGEERLLESAELHTFFGGAEANVAVALSHLGLRSDYVTRLPANPLGDAALEALQREGVGTGWILRGGARLGLYFVEPGADLRAMRVVYDRAGSALAQIEPGELDWTRVLAGADWFHTTGITPALGDGPATALADAVASARALHVPVSLDLNYREALWRGRDPRALIEPLARQADVLIGNAEAVRAMLGVEAGTDALPSRLVERCGCRVVAITQREILDAREHAWSAALYDAATRTLARSRRHVVRVVDRVGGGDSFAAGLIAALLGGQAPPAALEFAVAAGALKLAVPGDFGRATSADIERLVHQCT
ncbi:MAG TPA: sugar kinase [Gemmatimonadales bacterium]|nr:sugar kinase [Gemmatimonadales bacterium]